MNTAGLLVVLLLMSFLSGSSWSAAPLTDDDGGMTCRHYALAARLEWARKGGDWADADGEEYGDTPYAEQRVSRTSGPASAEFDITALAQAWAQGAQPAGTLLLRMLPRPSFGTVMFNSREHQDRDTHPVLHIEWAGGDRVTLRPYADTYLPCATHRSVGSERILRIATDRAAVLAFPFEVDGRKIERAIVVLTSSKQTANASVGVFRLLLPAGTESKARGGAAAAHPGDVGIEAHPDVVFATRFESPHWDEEWSRLGKGSRAEQASDAEGNGYEPFDGKSLKVTIPAGGTLGLELRYDFRKKVGREPEEMYFRYYLRFGDNWDPVKDGGKLPGFAGTYGRAGWGQRQTNGANGWSARGAFARRRPGYIAMEGKTGIGSYVYHAEMKQPSGDFWGWNLGPSGVLDKNRWYSIEQYVKLNDPDQPNGILRAWVDGYLVFERSDVRFRTVPDLRIEVLWMNVYHGGTTPAPHDMVLYVDNVVIARKYIGPVRN